MSKKFSIEDKGRITLPKSIRDKYGLIENENLVIEESEEGLIMKIRTKIFKRVKANINWKKLGFFKTGEISFGE